MLNQKGYSFLNKEKSSLLSLAEQKGFKEKVFIKIVQEIRNVVVWLMQMMQKHLNIFIILRRFHEPVLQAHLPLEQVAQAHPAPAGVGLVGLSAAGELKAGQWCVIPAVPYVTFEQQVQESHYTTLGERKMSPCNKFRGL